MVGEGRPCCDCVGEDRTGRHWTRFYNVSRVSFEGSGKLVKRIDTYITVLGKARRRGGQVGLITLSLPASFRHHVHIMWCGEHCG
jgi:hypothetical protein